MFVRTPTNVTVRAGGTARLECGAEGQPTPTVAWQKDGGDDFPAARERRMHVMPTDDVFFVVGLKAADSGVYTCTAHNPAGMVRASATLTVLGECGGCSSLKRLSVRSLGTNYRNVPRDGPPKSERKYVA